MLQIDHCHHVAIICRDLKASLSFYQEILGFAIIQEEYRNERDSWKVDLTLPGRDGMQIELFTFPNPPVRQTEPEACGLRHLAFAVADIETAVAELTLRGVSCEAIRRDESSGRRFVFLRDPDGLPIELCEFGS